MRRMLELILESSRESPSDGATDGGVEGVAQLTGRAGHAEVGVQHAAVHLDLTLEVASNAVTEGKTPLNYCNKLNKQFSSCTGWRYSARDVLRTSTNLAVLVTFDLQPATAPAYLQHYYDRGCVNSQGDDVICSTITTRAVNSQGDDVICSTITTRPVSTHKVMTSSAALLRHGLCQLTR